MRFEPIASGSTGNCYHIVGDSGTRLLIEAGISLPQIKRALKFNMAGLSGCLITHEHKDHSFAVKEVLKAGIDVYMTEGTRLALGVKHHRIHTIEAKEQFKIGEFTILPFMTMHDSQEPVGFLVSDGTDKLLYATDTFYIKYKFKGLTMIAVECNYDEEILNHNILTGVVPVVLKKRLLQSHFSFENYKKFLLANDLSNVREIWLIHMSNNNSDEERFQREIQAITGIPTYTT